jgi:type I restriction enzyme R subunit
MSIERPITKEDEISQIPALQLLQNMGWVYLEPEEVMQERRGNIRSVILEDILISQLKKINKFEIKGEKFDFSESNVANAVVALEEVPYEGLIKTSETLFELLTLGKSYEENVRGDIKSYDFKFIDWDVPLNNVFHVTEEFPVEKASLDGSHRRPDLVCFVNGIPFIVIECKRTNINKPIEEAIEQHIRNQKNDQIPMLYSFAQITMAIAPLDVEDDATNCLYATTGTPRSFWFPWRERTLDSTKLNQLVNTPLSSDRKERLFSGRFQHIKSYFDQLEKTPRVVTQQDEILFCLCHQSRLLEFVKEFILFDGGYKKIARYQQYYAVKATLRKITSILQPTETRPSGVIWHTQGSGKSLSMVMLAKAIAMEESIDSPKIILMTDRVELDRQIYKTFNNCGIPVTQAKTGNHLVELLASSRAGIITTIIDKFDTVVNSGTDPFLSNNIFILVDEAHRTQYGESNSVVQKIFPNACFIAYTGTPLTKNKKNTMVRFGKFYDTPYTARDALKDKAIVPLLYEGRIIPQDINEDIIDRWLERVTKPLSEDQRADLKKKFNSMNHLAKTSQRIFMGACDISEHFRQNWKGTGFKGLLAVDSVASAFKYYDYFKQLGEITAEVIISKPDNRKGHSEIEEDDAPPNKYQKMIQERFGGKEADYERETIAKFDSGDIDTPDILIVVWKLLTGFDVPRCAVLYLDKDLKEHTLLQAVARVNRQFDGKDFGFIIDYHGNLRNFRDAIKHYDELAQSEVYSDFDKEDREEINNSIHDVTEEIAKLPQYYSDLCDLFRNIENRLDIKAYEKALIDKYDRDVFYERLTRFASSLQLALSSAEYYSSADLLEISNYKKELKFFIELRGSVGQVYAEKVDYKDYSTKIERLLDTHVVAKEAKTVVKMFEIYEKAFDEETSKMSKGSKALTMLHRTKKFVNDNLERDPVFYERFSKLLQDTIEEYKQGRIDETELLKFAQKFKEQVLNRTGDNLPDILNNNLEAKAYYGILKDALKNVLPPDFSKSEELAKVAIKISDIVFNNIIVDWIKNINIQNNIKNEIEDLLFEVRSDIGIDIDYDTVDYILDNIIKTAKTRCPK